MSDTKVIATPANAPKCPQCGTPLPTGALSGLCPACLLKLGAAADTVTDGKQPAFNPPPVAELAPLFPQLEILELIGKGGMGAVYKARQKQLDRIVALKILPPGIGDDPAFAERFAREAKALAKLNHPGIVTLYEFGNVGQASRLSQTSEKTAPQSGPPEKNETGATPVLLFYFLMEFVNGVNLKQLLHAGRVSAREALAIVPQICDALQFAHDQGIVHRDIKPENILLDRRGRVKVADFGLAKLVGTDAPLSPSLSPSNGERVAKPGEGTPALTDAGKVMGTPQYMAPEQRDHPAEVDHRADIYALGVVFYQMLTGELPGKPLQPPSRKVQIDVRLDEVVLRALEKKPELRYQQASVLKTQVETIAGTGTEGASSHPPQTEPRFFDFTISMPQFVQRDGKARCYWPGVLLLFSTIGFAVCGFNLAIGLIIWLLDLKPPHGITFINFGDLWLWLVGLVFSAIGRLAALNLGAEKVVRARYTASKIVNVILILLVAAAWAFGLAHLAGWLRGASTTVLASSGFRIIVWIALLILGGSFLVRRVWRTVNKGSVGVPPVASGSNWRGVRRVIIVFGLLSLAILVALLLSSYFRAGPRFEIHYRVFEVETAVADELVIVAQREIGATGNWQMAQISPESLAALLDGRVLNRHVMIDRYRSIQGSSSSRTYVNTHKPGVAQPVQKVITGWPVVTDSWGHSLANHVANDIAQVSGSGFFGVRHNAGMLQLKLEYTLTHKIGDRPAVDVNVSYEGNAPRSGALAFLIPFARKDNSTGYFVLTVEVNEAAANATKSTCELVQLNDPPFVAWLPQAEVELVAIGNQPWSNTVCWLPNGQPSTEPFPAGNFELNGWAEGKVMRKIAFRIRSECADDLSYPLCRINQESGVLPQGSGMQPADARHADADFIQLIACPTNATTMNVSLGVANGAWETAIVLDKTGPFGGPFSSERQEGEWSATYNAVFGKARDAAVSFIYTKSQAWETRMVYVNADGKLIPIRENSSHAITGQTGATLLVSSNEFACIKEFRLQKRKYHWVEFRNVSLRSGHRTKVEVHDAQEMAHTRQGQSGAAVANPPASIAAASAETWSPKLAPGEKPDVDKIRQEASDLMKQGRYEESLQRHIWYHNHALEFGVGQTGVRLSFALSDWVELGRRYPKAKQALIEIRDAKTRELEEGRGHADLFHDVAGLNDYLQNRDATFELFKNIQQRDSGLAKQCYFYAEDLLVEKGEYELCYGYMGDPQRRFEVIRSGWEMEKQMYQRQAESRKQHPQPAGLPSPADKMREANKRFVGKIRQLIEILVGAGHKAEVETIRDQAVKLLDDAQLKSAVGDAEQAIRYKPVQPASETSAIPEQTQPASAPQFRWVADEGDTNSPADLLPDPNDRLGRAKLRVLKAVAFDGSTVAQAGWQADQNGMKQIVLRFTESGRQRFAGITSANVGRRLAVVQQGQVITAPVIASAINTPTLNLGGRWSLGEITRILTGLNSDGSASQSIQFGQSREDVLSPLVGPDYVFLNLRDCRSVTNRTGSLGSRETRDWMRRNGADVAAAAEDQIPIAICYDMVALPAETNAWETATPVEVKFHWALMTAESEKETPVGKVTGTPDTYYFRTRDDAWGILQITGFTENPRGVKIRYKLVRNEVDKSPQPMPTRPTAAAVYDSIKDIQKSFAHRTNDPEIRKTLLNEIAPKLEEFQNLVRGTEVQPPLDYSGELTREVVNSKDQARIAEIQKELTEIDRKIGELVHRPSFPTAGPTRVTMPQQKLSSDAVLNESPKLQFLAWQDEWKTDQPGAARHPDGSPVTNKTELSWLRAVPPLKDSRGWAMMETNCRALHLWFSHPQFDEKSLNEISLLDYRGFKIQHGRIAAGCRRANEQNGNLGWLLHTVLVTNTLTRASVRLYSTTGPLERTFDVQPTQKGELGLEDGGYFVNIGQNAEGKALVSFAVDAARMPSREVGVVAVTPDGRELPYRAWSPPGVDSSGLKTGKFEFNISFSDISKFRIGTRSIRTNEWKNVVLPRK